MKLYDYIKTKFNVRLNMDLAQITDVLKKAGFEILDNYYMLHIYMIPKKIQISSISSLNQIETYAIIKDINGQQKKITYMNKGELIGSIQDVSSTKQLLDGLGLKELMFVNYDITIFSAKDIDIVVKEVKNQGIFLEVVFKTSKYSDTEKVAEYLLGIGTIFDTLNLNVDNVQIALDSVKGNV